MESSILVTGGAGFIGSHLVDSFLDQGHKVVVIDDFNDYYNPAIKRTNCRPHQDYPNYMLVEGDIRDRELIDRCFKEHDFQEVIHLASRAGVRPSIQHSRLYHEVNIEGTLNILEACREHKVGKLILASSSSVYGNNPKIPFSESDAVDNPVSPYASTKKAMELMAYTYHHLYGIDTTCLRFFTVYGPRQRPEMAIHMFTDRIANGQSIPVFGDGDSSRDYTFISDVIRGIEACRVLKAGYEVINIGRSDPIRLIDLIRLIENVVGRTAKLDYQPCQKGDVERTYADISKAKRMLNYTPEVSIEKGIKLFYDWYVSNRELLLK